MVKERRALDEAIGWLIRQRDPSFAEWDGFTAWLEADPANAAAYAELAARDAELADHLGKQGPAVSEAVQDNDPPERAIGRRGMMAGLVGIAASVAAVFGATQLLQDGGLYPVSTPPGVQRTVTLAGGTTVRLNGGTRLKLDKDDPRYAEVTEGEALFAVVHDAERPFRVDVAGAELVDLGTRFTVEREAGETEVAVSEGVVMYNPEGEAIRLDAGKMLRAADGDAVIRVSSVDAGSVGSWAEGRLVWDNVPLAAVAGDLSRALGVRVTADPAVAARPVTAVLQLPADRSQVPARLEKLLDITVSQRNGGWILTNR